MQIPDGYFEGMILRAADTMRVKLSESEVNRALYLFVALYSMAGVASTLEYERAALYLVKFIVEWRE